MRHFLILLTLSMIPSSAWSQMASSLNCFAISVPTVVRSEGLAEPLGDIVLQCKDGTPGGVITANVTVTITVPLTNRLGANGLADTFLTVDTGSGPMSAGTSAMVIGPSAVTFNGMNFALPPNGSAIIRISNLRGNASQSINRPIQAFVSTTGSSALAIQGTPLTVATPLTGLLAGHSTTFICRYSPIPEQITFTNLLLQGTRFASSRITEGFATAFLKKTGSDDAGTRIVARYSGLPAPVRLFLPDVIAGSTAVQQTSAGDLGLTASGGKYAPGGNGSLLLARVRGHDSNGAGGTPVYQPGAAGSGTVAFDSASEVPLSNGSGIAVYEVIDSNPSIQESAQFPTFIGLPFQELATNVKANFEISLGPVSTIGTAANQPVPRFLAINPPPDCTLLRDCSVNFPKMRVESPALNFTGPAGSAHQLVYLGIYNDGGGILEWSATVTYKNGTGWVRLEPPAGTGGVRVDVLPEKLQPGVYEATLTIDAGPIAGTRSLPITLRVTDGIQPPVQPPAAVNPQVDRVLHSANFAPGVAVPGSLISLMGVRFNGTNVQVTFDGTPGRIQFRNDSQINVEVPPQLGLKASTQLAVVVDGRTSTTQTLRLTPVAPAIFAGAVFNQNNSGNTANNPAVTGTVIQIFLAGLPSNGKITAKLHDVEIDTPYYAGPAPGVPGVQQVNLVVPEHLPTMPTEVLICGAHSERPSERVCSAPVTLHLLRIE